MSLASPRNLARTRLRVLPLSHSKPSSQRDVTVIEIDEVLAALFTKHEGPLLESDGSPFGVRSFDALSILHQIRLLGESGAQLAITGIKICCLHEVLKYTDLTFRWVHLNLPIDREAPRETRPVLVCHLAESTRSSQWKMPELNLPLMSYVTVPLRSRSCRVWTARAVPSTSPGWKDPINSIINVGLTKQTVPCSFFLPSLLGFLLGYPSLQREGKGGRGGTEEIEMTSDAMENFRWNARLSLRIWNQKNFRISFGISDSLFVSWDFKDKSRKWITNPSMTVPVKTNFLFSISVRYVLF